MAYRTLMSYYGGKGKRIGVYPPPEYDTIVEPFAGAAAYSLRYHEKKVLIIDYDHLRRYCLSRSGHVIVCESDTADWLDFRSISGSQSYRVHRPNAHLDGEGICIINNIN